MCLALSTSVLLIALKQSVNGAQFVKFAFLFVLFTSIFAAAVFPSVIVHLGSMHASL